MAVHTQPPAGGVSAAASTLSATATQQDMLAELVLTNRAILLLLSSAYGLKDTPEQFLAASGKVR